MPTTKPPRKRNGADLGPSRFAPTYRRLPDEAYKALDEIEKRKHDGHIDIDAMMAAYEYAVLDRDSIGFPGKRGYDGTGRGGAVWPVETGQVDANGNPVVEDIPATSVEAAALHRQVDRATVWLAEFTEALAMVTNCANKARLYFGFDPGRGRDEPSRPKHSSQVESCVWCDQPAPDGRDDHGKPLIKRVDQRPVHAHPCYQTLGTQALRAKMTVSEYLAAKIAKIAKVS